MRKIAVALALALVLAGIWIWRTNTMPATDPAGETLGPMVDVVVPELEPAAQRGEAAFNGICAECHGANAAGVNGMGPPLVHKIYEPGHHGDQSFVLATQRGVRSHHWKFGDMPPVDGLSDDDTRSIIIYVRALQRANGIN